MALLNDAQAERRHRYWLRGVLRLLPVREEERRSRRASSLATNELGVERLWLADVLAVAVEVLAEAECLSEEHVRTIVYRKGMARH